MNTSSSCINHALKPVPGNDHSGRNLSKLVSSVPLSGTQTLVKHVMLPYFPNGTLHSPPPPTPLISVVFCSHIKFLQNIDPRSLGLCFYTTKTKSSKLVYFVYGSCPSPYFPSPDTLTRYLNLLRICFTSYSELHVCLVLTN